MAILWGCISDPNESLSDVTQVSKIEVKDNTLSFADFAAYEDAIQNPDEITDLVRVQIDIPLDRTARSILKCKNSVRR